MQTLDVKALDKIVKNTMKAVENSRTQIFDIYEAARIEVDNVTKDIERVRQAVERIICSVDELERRERKARLRLMEVSRNFRVYSEDDIKEAYEDAKDLQVDLAVAREQEKDFRRQRDDLDVRLKSLQTTVTKAENLVSQVGVVLGYLGNQIGGVANTIESLQQSQHFGAKIIQAQEEERRRVSREIHDGPAQAMANIVFRAEVCERLVDIDVERAKKELADLREQVRTCLKETRKIIFDLRPMTLDDLGLAPTVKRVLDTMCERNGICVDIRIIGEEKRLDSYLEVGLFRVIQEALNNVEKHAAASNLKVIIEFNHSGIAVVIEDNGKGFDPAANKGEQRFGLLGIRERMNLLNGDIAIKSVIGQGTRMTLKIPL